MVEIAGHKLSDSIIQRLPTLSLMTPGQRISYSEVFAFHNSTSLDSLPGLTCSH
jgi:solute carrier family 25 aspartate/glutamate transporter 12/13